MKSLNGTFSLIAIPDTKTQELAEEIAQSLNTGTDDQSLTHPESFPLHISGYRLQECPSDQIPQLLAQIKFLINKAFSLKNFETYEDHLLTWEIKTITQSIKRAQQKVVIDPQYLQSTQPYHTALEIRQLLRFQVGFRPHIPLFHSEDGIYDPTLNSFDLENATRKSTPHLYHNHHSARIANVAFAELDEYARVIDVIASLPAKHDLQVTPKFQTDH